MATDTHFPETFWVCVCFHKKKIEFCDKQADRRRRHTYMTPFITLCYGNLSTYYNILRSCLLIRWEWFTIFLLNKPQCSVDIPLPITAINWLRVVSRSPSQFFHILITNLAFYESFPFILPALSGLCLIISSWNCPACNSSSFCFFFWWNICARPWTDVVIVLLTLNPRWERWMCFLTK